MQQRPHPQDMSPLIRLLSFIGGLSGGFFIGTIIRAPIAGFMVNFWAKYYGSEYPAVPVYLSWFFAYGGTFIICFALTATLLQWISMKVRLGLAKSLRNNRPSQIPEEPPPPPPRPIEPRTPPPRRKP